MCDVLSDFSRECSKALGHGLHNCVEWRTERLCPLMCESKNKNKYDCVWHYECCGNHHPIMVEYINFFLVFYIT